MLQWRIQSVIGRICIGLNKDKKMDDCSVTIGMC